MATKERLFASLRALDDLMDTLGEVAEGLDYESAVVVMKASTALRVRRGVLWLEYSRALLVAADVPDVRQEALREEAWFNWERGH
jgi:hypothetical protein